MTSKIFILLDGHLSHNLSSPTGRMIPKPRESFHNCGVNTSAASRMFSMSISFSELHCKSNFANMDIHGK